MNNTYLLYLSTMSTVWTSTPSSTTSLLFEYISRDVSSDTDCGIVIKSIYSTGDVLYTISFPK